MKVYAVIERCVDSYYSDYMVVDDCVYLNEEDAKKRLDELVKEKPYLREDLEIYDFEVRE